MAEVVRGRAAVAIGLDAELPVAGPTTDPRPELTLGERVARMEVPHALPRRAAVRQEAIAIDVDVVQRGARHLVNRAPGPADVAHHLEPRPLSTQVADRLLEPRGLLARQAVELQPGRVAAETLDAHEPDVPAEHGLVSSRSRDASRAR